MSNNFEDLKKHFYAKYIFAKNSDVVCKISQAWESGSLSPFYGYNSQCEAISFTGGLKREVGVVGAFVSHMLDLAGGPFFMMSPSGIASLQDYHVADIFRSDIYSSDDIRALVDGGMNVCALVGPSASWHYGIQEYGSYLNYLVDILAEFNNTDKLEGLEEYLSSCCGEFPSMRKSDGWASVSEIESSKFSRDKEGIYRCWDNQTLGFDVFSDACLSDDYFDDNIIICD